jgi:immune inhibitor A
MKNNNLTIGLIIGGVLLFFCLGAICLIAGGVAFFWLSSVQTGPGWELESPRVTTVEVRPATPTTRPDNLPAEPNATEQPTFNTEKPSLESAYETVRTLEENIVPINDPRDLAYRLEGKVGIPETLAEVPPLLEVGAQKEFWVMNMDTNQYVEVEATLRYVTDHLYFWIQNGVFYNANDLRDLSETFENDIYPTNREFFGSEWSPGIDNDPHLYVLYARGLGSSIAGYFSSADSLHPDAHQYSNAHEMFVLSADNVDLGEQYIYGTMAHEFQHMIHWYRDRNEESWMNEGFSVLAELLNGYDPGPFDLLYVQNPDMQLNYWPAPPDSRPHYGSSFLFLAYFLDRFGEDATKALVAHPENGMHSIDAVLREMDEVDPITGQVITADDVFADWIITSYLNDPNVADGRYAYRLYTNAPSPGPTERIDNCSADWEQRTVHQYGADYIQINCSGSYTLLLEGDSEVGVLPVGSYSGDYFFWSNKGDESNMTLTQTFDFTGVSGPVTLNFRTWYDLEEDYDYLHLVVSEDGEQWDIITTPSGTDYNPAGNSYGWGYNGQTGGWIEESVDLSAYAGKEVQVRFEYVTDAAVNGEGFLLDDISIPEIGYFEDFEQGDGGWTGEGFVRIQNRLPQTFRVSLIHGDQISVETYTVPAGETLEITLDLGPNSGNTVLAVSGVTRYTTQIANYSFSFRRD